MTTKATPPVLSLQNKRSLANLFDNLIAAVEVLIQGCRKGSWNEVDDAGTNVKSYVRSIKDEIPEGLAKSQVSALDRHAQFVEVYTRKQDRKFVLSNAHSIRPDIQRLSAALGIGGKDELRASVEALSSSIERDLLDEAVRCLEAESPRAAVVMAVCALENLLRRFYESKTGQDSKKTEFWRVIDEVAKLGGLSDSEKVLMDQCRGFRNFAAHPSQYSYSKGDAQGIIHLAAEQVRKRKDH